LRARWDSNSRTIDPPRGCGKPPWRITVSFGKHHTYQRFAVWSFGGGEGRGGEGGGVRDPVQLVK